MAAGALVLGLAGGYPVGARTAAELYAQGALTRDEAERLLTFWNNANPAFLLSGLGLGALGAILGICAFVELFYVLGLPLRRLPAPWGAGLAGAVELFSASAGLPAGRHGFILAAGLAGFGGLSVLCQTAAVLAPQGLSPAPCFRGKLLLKQQLSRKIVDQAAGKAKREAPAELRLDVFFQCRVIFNVGRFLYLRLPQTQPLVAVKRKTVAGTHVRQWRANRHSRFELCDLLFCFFVGFAVAESIPDLAGKLITPDIPGLPAAILPLENVFTL